MTEGAEQGYRDWVGPVLHRGAASNAVIAAIRELNPAVVVMDRGSYLRVLVRRRCVLTREAVERQTGSAFVLPGALEGIMSSFKGRLELGGDSVCWELTGAV